MHCIRTVTCITGVPILLCMLQYSVDLSNFLHCYFLFPSSSCIRCTANQSCVLLPEKCPGMHTSILYPHQYKILVYRLMHTSVSAFHLVPTADPSNNKEWWHIIYVDIFEVLPASLAMELHCIQYISASVWLSFAHVDKNVSTDLISLWYLGLRCT